MRRTAPSVRNSVSSMRRAPSPRRSSANCSRRASRSMVAEHVLLARDRLGKALLGDVGRDRQPRRSGSCSRPSARSSWRSSSAPKRAVSGARGRSMISPMRFKPTRASAGDGRRRKPQRGERQWREQRAFLAGGMTCRLAVTRGGPGGADGAGDGDAHRRSRRVSSRPREIGDQRLLAAIKMRAAADVEQQTVGRIAGDQRRVAQAPVGDGFEQGGVGFGIFGNRLECRDAWRALAPAPDRAEAEPLGRFIDRDEEFDIAALAGRRRAARCLRRVAARTAARCGRSRAGAATG